MDSTAAICCIRRSIRRAAPRPVADQRGATGARHRRRRWSITTTCSRFTTFTPTCRIAIWAASRATCDKVLDEFRPKLPKGSFIETRGQVETMRTSFIGPGGRHDLRRRAGLLRDGGELPVWLDPFIILMALPGALGGYSTDAFCHPDHYQRSIADGRYHEHRGGNGEQHSAGEFRQRSARRGRGRDDRGTSKRALRGCGQW